MKKMFWDLFSQVGSDRTEKIRSAIINSEVGYFDETGIRCKKTLHWLHNGSTSWATCYILHARRGQEAMDELVSYQ